MWIMSILFLIILYEMYQAYQEGKANSAIRTSYRQAKCCTCKHYSNKSHICLLENNPNSCYIWEHKEGVVK